MLSCTAWGCPPARELQLTEKATIEDEFTETSPKLTKKNHGCQKISSTDVGNYTITV